ncbi:MAG: hypothetical protein DRP64_13620, partial [Verrucomicrobia bacterium]
MKRPLIAIAILAALPPGAFAQETHLDIKVPDTVESDFFGPIKSVETDTCYNMSDKHLKEIRSYDANGNLLGEMDWNYEGELTSSKTNYYNERGCLTEYRFIDHKDGETNHWEVILSPPTRQIAKRNKKTGTTDLRTYSPEKYLLHYKKTDKKKKLVKASRTQRREDNRETEYTRFNQGNRPLYTYYFQWDDRGFVTKERLRYHQEKKERLHTYDFLKVDEHGNWTQRLMTRYDVG